MPITDIERVPDELVRFIFIAKEFDLSWEPNRGPDDTIRGIMVSADSQTCAASRRIFERLIRLPITSRYQGAKGMNVDFHEFELRGWEQSATAYERYFTNIALKTSESIKKSIKLSKVSSALDVACGPGHLTARLNEIGGNVVGIDFSESMINIAKSFYPSCRFEVGDAQDLPYAEGVFDAVVINFGILHLAWPEKAISEAYRVLKRGGRFAMTVWDTPEKSIGFRIINEAINLYGNKEIVPPEGPPFFKFADSGVAEKVLQDVEFQDVFIDEISEVWELPDRDALFRAFFEGTARTGGVLRLQTDNILEKIRTFCAEKAAFYENNDNGNRVNIPMVIKMIVGIKF